MQLDAKLVDGMPLIREERAERDARAKDELPEVAGEEVVADRPGITETVDRDHRTLLLAAVRAIFEGKQLQIQQLHVSAQEVAALEALRTAIEGKDTELSQFVFADDRRDLLEQALAILQPNLTHGDAENLSWLYTEMKGRVAELREKLDSKAEAQEEVVEINHLLRKHEAPTDTDPDAELDDKNADDVVPAEPAPWATTLIGPEVLAEARHPSTLGDTDAPDDDRG